MDLAIQPAMDVLQLSRALYSKCGFLTTHLYSKLRSPAFAFVPTIHWPHIHSDITAACKYGVIVSRFHHYVRIITDLRNFVCEMALLLRLYVNAGL